MGGAPVTVTVRYFAALRDYRGLSQEPVVSPASDPMRLYLHLSAKHGFPLAVEQIRFVVNGSYVEPTKELLDGDEVVFIPPVAGG